MNHRNLCFKRIIAFIIDTYLSAVPAQILSALLGKHIDSIYGFFLLILIISIFTMLIFRDLIFGGRSIGKRIFGLTVIDNTTYLPATPSKLVIRNLFFPIYVIDGIILLCSGLTIGERVTHTMVIPINDYRITSFAKAPVKISSEEKAKAIKTVVCVVLAIALLLGALVLYIFSQLEKLKDTEEYITAYEYFTNSETFTVLSSDKINFTGYKQGIVTCGDERQRYTVIAFVVNGENYGIVCHEKGDSWYVCQDCTQVK